MKLLLIFILLTQSSIAQINFDDPEVKSYLIDSLILGDWYLVQTDVVDGYNAFSDTNKFTSAYDRNKKITFTADSLYNYRDETVRFYKRLEHYVYRIEYDSLMRTNDLKLYSGKKRKQREVEFYEIIHCSRNELIIKSFHYLSEGIDAISFSIIYVYRREPASELAENIKAHEWFFCSDKSVQLFSDKDTLEFEFSPSSEELECDEFDHHIHLSFETTNYRNMVSVYEYKGVIGGGYIPISYSLDTGNSLLFVNFVKPFVYNISIVDEKLILSLNKEKTADLRGKTDVD